MSIYLLTTHGRHLEDNLNGSDWFVAATPEIDRSVYDGIYWMPDPSSPEDAARQLDGIYISALVTSDRSYATQVIREFRGPDARDDWLYLSTIGEDGAINGTKLMNLVALHGTGADNVLRGGNPLEEIFGYGGDDRIFGGGGSDLIHGGDGNDRIDGGDGYDTIYGDGGRDRIDGGIWVDTIYGGFGKDRVDGGRDSDVIYGGPGDDRLDGNDGMDEIYGGAGDDVIRGDHGFIDNNDDKLYGGDGDDHITEGRPFDILSAIPEGIMRGDAGNDTLIGLHGSRFGGAGNDRIVGSRLMFGEDGNDRLVRTYSDYFEAELTGGEGVDRFIFSFRKNDGPGDDRFVFPSHSLSTILDFDPEKEKVDLRPTPFDSLDDFTVYQRSGYTHISWDDDRENLFTLTIRHTAESLTEAHFLF